MHDGGLGLFLLGLDGALDGMGQTRMANPMKGARRGGHQATTQLVFPLGSSLEAGPAIFNAYLNGSVIAEFEVKALEARLAAPVPAIQGRRAAF